MMTPANPSSLGEFLRHEREKRGITVEQVASATKISLRLLHSLENDLYQELPAKPFIRGFVIAYCRFLGVDPQEVLTRFSHFIEEKSEERPRKDAGHSGYAFERREGDSSRTGLWILMGSMLAIGALVLLIAKPSLKRHHRSEVERLRAANAPSPVPSVSASPEVATSPAPAVSVLPSPSPAASPSPSPSLLPKPSPSPTPSASPSPAPSASAAPSPGPSRKPDPMLSGKDLLKEEVRVRVVVKAGKDMWVKFKVDGKDKNRLVLREGITLVLLGRESVAVQTSNPEDAQITQQAGEPNALKSLAPVQSLAKILESKRGVTDDGRTLWVPAQVAETLGNPFKGETPMSPPPPKPVGAASEGAAASP